MSSSISRIATHLRRPRFWDEVRRVLVGLGDNILQRPRPRIRRPVRRLRVLVIADGGVPWIDFLEPVFIPILHVSLEDILSEGIEFEFPASDARDMGRDWRTVAAVVVMAALSAYSWHKARRRGRPAPQEVGGGAGDEGPGGAGGPRQRPNFRCRPIGGLLDLVVPEARRARHQWWRPTRGLLDLLVLLAAGPGGGGNGPGGRLGLPGGAHVLRAEVEVLCSSCPRAGSANQDCDNVLESDDYGAATLPKLGTFEPERTKKDWVEDCNCSHPVSEDSAQVHMARILIKSLSEEELRQACRECGHLGLLSTEETRQQLPDWLDLSLNHAMPSCLLILSRAFTPSGKMRPEEAVVATLSSEALNTVGTVLPSEDSVSERRRKLEFLEMQEELSKIGLYDSMLEKEDTEGEEEAKRACMAVREESDNADEVDAMLQELEKEIDDVDAQIGNRWQIPDRDHDGKVTPEEVAAAAAYLKDLWGRKASKSLSANFPKTKLLALVQELISRLSKDNDGKIRVEDIVKLGSQTEENNEDQEEESRQ